MKQEYLRSAIVGDGMGTMVARTREAIVEDLTGIRKTIKLLEESGALVRRIDEEVRRLSLVQLCSLSLKKSVEMLQLLRFHQIAVDKDREINCSECSISMIPEARQERINLSRRSKYYMKKLLPDRSGISVVRTFQFDF
ncbi:PREDICTED: probable amino-acid acetyltransferase NAGS1, chloroplastic [Camelina sativa]|uniref:Probable amino-acid acetyltransferase NAGS1, chloroplastic n=1 Tax=Camelina sativa TaxID=90675 RepID=A0ABM0UHK5_CAMSA|nr:PREDICTED: probable amino-acid acetyltransferase NAGS1, chloroplastic [Camelina sativa]XP_010441259.1 PREDICTED: probable amino-acid acetyltransferase NAGS1, chloroplastic [Camelina sativa]XP_019087078.1 PREDICTED: probable amino-acid acetyltransferase NAGS1, chloroplastic [Camelina sativa]